MPDVTVVVPTRGRRELLELALASLRADDSAAVELIVVENGSEVVDEQLVGAGSLIRLPAAGRSRARNAGAEAASAPLVAFLDSDDLTLPGRFARQLETLSDSSAALCFGRITAIDADGEVDPVRDRVERERFDRLLERGAGYESLLLDCPIYTSATMVRRDAFLDVGGYRTELDAFEDLDLYLRLSRAGGLVACDGAPLARHRLHGANTTNPEFFAGSLRVARLHLAAGPPSETARRLLLERELDALWALDDFGAVRAEALRAVRSRPSRLRHRRFRRRLLGSLLPGALLRRRRGSRT